MIAPQELRLENLVTDSSGRIFKVMELLSGYLRVYSEKKDWLNSQNKAYIDLEPIELTEDWLLKFGFEKHNDGSVSSQYSYGLNPVTHDYLIYLIWIKDPIRSDLPKYPFYLNGHFEMKTVHQLQNLYFALTGEELTIKE
ncbi:hypothetical protein [Chryseobacterium culicis]|uniref:hypothetical protein n=1 Tax=Chryseobacterium culicis TaxID=680127 RepID=UPI0018735EA8|nr:hypothetical protein [Chryseobacterium culicis]MBE4949931.1 hypothetical protein [Chryseobacterium culicis]